MIISFAWTWGALVEGRFERWVRAWRRGRLIHSAWTNLPFVTGARHGADIRLTCEPYWEALADMPLQDLRAEGGYWDSIEEFIELFGGDPMEEVVVIRFVLEHLY